MLVHATMGFDRSKEALASSETRADTGPELEPGKRTRTQGLASSGGGERGIALDERARLLRRVVDNATTNPLYAKQGLATLTARFGTEPGLQRWAEGLEPLLEQRALELRLGSPHDGAIPRYLAERPLDGAELAPAGEVEAERESAEVVEEVESTEQELAFESTAEPESPEPSPEPAPAKRTQRYRLTLALSADLRAQVRALYESYRRTRQVPSLAALRDTLVRQLLHIAIPMELARADLLADSLKLYIDCTDAELLAGLVGLGALPKGKGPLPAREPVKRHHFTVTDELLADLRGRSGVKRPEPTPGPTPSPALVPPDSGALAWIWGLLQGDFNEDPSVSQQIVGGLLSLIPGVDQVFDARDVIANLYALIGQGKVDQAEPWFNLVVTLIGAIPEVGSIVKTVVKLVKRGLAKLPLDEVLGVIGKLGGEDGLELLAKHLDELLGVSAWTGAIRGRIETVLGSLAATAEAWRDRAALVSTAAQKFFARIARGAREALARAAEQVERAMQEVAARLRELVEAVRERLAKRATKDTPAPETPKPPDATLPTPTPKPELEAPTPGPAGRRPAQVEPAKPEPTRPSIAIDESTPRLTGGGLSENFVVELGGQKKVVKLIDGTDLESALEAARLPRKYGGIGEGTIEQVATREGKRDAVVMPFIDGKTLYDTTQLLPSHVQAFRRYMEAARADGVVFGDLNRRNILIRPDGDVTIIDNPPTTFEVFTRVSKRFGISDEEIARTWKIAQENFWIAVEERLAQMEALVKP